MSTARATEEAAIFEEELLVNEVLFTTMTTETVWTGMPVELPMREAR